MAFGLTLSLISNTLKAEFEMKNLLSVLLILSTIPNLFAQDSENAHQSLTSRKYHEYRQAITAPSYHLAKINALVSKIKEDKDGNLRLPEKAYNALSFEEKFTYTMIHGEDSSQNCDAMMSTVKEESKIFGYFPDAFSGGNIVWSDRQRDFLTKNRSKVVSLLRATIKLRQRVGVNLKDAILEINGKELVPDLIAAYNIKKKDHDILTLLMLMMREDKFPEFIKSTSFTKLYGENSNYKGYLEATPANQKLIIERAMTYYKSGK